MAEAAQLRGGGQQISNQIMNGTFTRGPWDGGDAVDRGMAQDAHTTTKASPRSPRSPRPPASPRPTKGQFQGQGNGRQVAQKGAGAKPSPRGRGAKQSPRPAPKPKGGVLALSKAEAPVLDRGRFRLPASLIPDIVIPFRVPRDQRVKLVTYSGGVYKAVMNFIILAVVDSSFKAKVRHIIELLTGNMRREVWRQHKTRQASARHVIAYITVFTLNDPVVLIQQDLRSTGGAWLP